MFIGSSGFVEGAIFGHTFCQPDSTFAQTEFITDQPPVLVLANTFLVVDHVVEPVLANKPIQITVLPINMLP
jgi:hypothetical protein